MPQFEEWELSKYYEIFAGLDPVNGVLTGEKAAPVLKNSQLGDDQLERIWDLSDVDQDGNLDFEEFCIAMRLIFDIINGTYSDVPETLPEWLVPASKAHLVAANMAVRQGTTGTPTYSGSGDDDDDLGLSSDFDWYISPSDRNSYNAIYSANADYRGMISFESLTELYQSLGNVPETDIRSAWNLVNPRSDEKIEREQCIIFLHILNNRSKGVRVPRAVPASLRATFEKSKPEYDINSRQGQINKPAPPPPSSTSSKKSAFAEGYLSRLGLGGRSQAYSTSGTDFSSTKDTDWEEVRLKRELADLEEQIRRAEDAADRRKRGVDDYGSSRAALVRRELEKMLEYKEDQIRKLRSGQVGSGNNTGDLASANEEVELIAEQIRSLQEHQNQKQQELDNLNSQLQALS
uniref:Actin cytoskeleton-regulatory complex protein END3 n=1 Tax=Blastobotrys adeninivorans TaxID=409370 RepID=A0A060T292_BLAAD